MNGALTEVLRALSRDLAGLLPLARDCPPWELVDAQRALETAFRTMHAVQSELDGAVDAAGVCNGHGYASVRGMLRDLHQLTQRKLTAREARREQLATRLRRRRPPRLHPAALSDPSRTPRHRRMLC